MFPRLSAVVYYVTLAVQYNTHRKDRLLYIRIVHGIRLTKDGVTKFFLSIIIYMILKFSTKVVVHIILDGNYSILLTVIYVRYTVLFVVVNCCLPCSYIHPYAQKLSLSVWTWLYYSYKNLLLI